MPEYLNPGKYEEESWAKAAWPLAFAVTFGMAAVNTGAWIAFISCAVLFVSFLLVRRVCNPFSLHRMTIPGFWYLAYFVFIFLPTFYVYWEMEGPFRNSFLFAVLSVLITVPLGWVCASQLVGYHKEEVENFFRGDLTGVQVTARFTAAFIFLSVLAAVLYVVYVREVETIPLFYLFTSPGAALELALLREESFKLLNSPFLYIFGVLRSVIYPFLILSSVGAYLVTRSRRWFWLATATVIAGTIFEALSLAKAPVATIVLMLAFFAYYYRKGILSGRAITAFLIAAFLFPLFVVLGVDAGTDLGLPAILDAVQGIADRLFHIPAETLYYYFEYFPAHMQFLHGRSIHLVATVFRMQFVDVPNLVGQYIYPFGFASITANSAFNGDLYADFGLIGVLIGGFLAGLIMQWIHVVALRRRKTVVGITIYTFLVVAFSKLVITTLPQILASEGVVLVFVLAWFFERNSGLKVPQEQPKKKALRQAPGET